MELDSPETIIQRIDEEVADTGKTVWSVAVQLLDEPSGEPIEEDIIDQFAILDTRYGMDENDATSTLMDLSLNYWIVGVEVQDLDDFTPESDEDQYATLWLYMYPTSIVDYQTNINAEVIEKVLDCVYWTKTTS